MLACDARTLLNREDLWPQALMHYEQLIRQMVKQSNLIMFLCATDTHRVAAMALLV